MDLYIYGCRSTLEYPHPTTIKRATSKYITAATEKECVYYVETTDIDDKK
jgi:hypothetical protein